MYRAHSDVNLDWEAGNLNFGNLAGVLKYLHTEIAPLNYPDERKYAISRILRFSVLVNNPEQERADTPFGLHHTFVAFDYGRCTVPLCSRLWQAHGFYVGCQQQRKGALHSYEDAVWYSLPGACPSEQFDRATEACVKREPGGQCDAPDGGRQCTWHVKLVGAISLDELIGVRSYKELHISGGREYDPTTDRGIGTSFWDGILDAEKSNQRVFEVMKLFARKYHLQPMDLPEPPCGG